MWCLALLLVAVTVYSQITVQGEPLLFFGGKTAGAWFCVNQYPYLPCLHGFLGVNFSLMFFSSDYPSDKGIADATRSQMFSSVADNKLVFCCPLPFLSLHCAALGHTTALSAAKVTVCEISRLLSVRTACCSDLVGGSPDIAVRLPVRAHTAFLQNVKPAFWTH